MIVKTLRDVTVSENQPSVLICELNKPDVQVQWTKGDQVIKTTDSVKITSAGVFHTLTIEKTTLLDEDEYVLTAGDVSCKAEILVDGRLTQLY